MISPTQKDLGAGAFTDLDSTSARRPAPVAEVLVLHVKREPPRQVCTVGGSIGRSDRVGLGDADASVGLSTVPRSRPPDDQPGGGTLHEERKEHDPKGGALEQRSLRKTLR